MNKINNLACSKIRPSRQYKDLDIETELIYRMDNQEFKNLHKLDNYKVLVDKNSSFNQDEPIFLRSYSEAYKTD